MRLADLKLNPDNPRNIKPEKLDKLAQSIKDFPKMMVKRPIVYDENKIIIGGNMRYKAIEKLGMTEIPDEWTSDASDFTPEERKRFIMQDNAEMGVTDWDMVANQYELEDLEAWGIDVPYADTNEEVEEDEAPEVSSEPPVSQLGVVYQLGRHRVMCGDSTDALNYKHLTQGVKVDLVFTDPPYGMKKEADGVLNDNLNYDKLLEFNKQWIPHTFDALKDNGSWYCWGIDEPLMDIYSEILKPMIKANEITFRNLITWDKGYGQGQLSDEYRMYPIADEKCLFVMCGVQGFNNNSDNYFNGWEPIRKYLNEEMEKCGGAKNWRKALSNEMGKHYFTKSQWCFPTEENYKKLQAFGKEYGAFGKEYEQIKREYEQIKKEYEQIKKEYYSTRAYFNNTHDNMNNVWHFDRTGNKERELTGGHATPKPIALCSRAIKSSSREDEIVLDVFGGSGSTLIACEQTDRTCYGMELDEKYLDVIRKRWAKYVYPDRWEKEWEILTPAIAK